MKKSKYLGTILRISIISFLILQACSQKKSSIFDEVYSSYNESKPWLYVFAPPAYCKGCMSRTLNCLRQNLSIDDYQFILLREETPYKHDNEKFIILSEELYENSVDYDYLMHAFVIMKDKSVEKFSLDTEESFEKLDSIVRFRLQ